MSQFDINMKQLKEIIKLLKESDMNEIKLEQGDMSVQIRRDSAKEQVVTTVPAPATPATTAAPSAPAPAKPAEETATKGDFVKSPMVGTFYSSPNPEASPFVKVGDRVTKGQTLCIIEAMKTMNQIEAESDGVVEQILINNAMPVEFGEPLFVLSA